MKNTAVPRNKIVPYLLYPFLLFVLLSFSSCAQMGSNFRHEGDTLLADHPKFSVLLKKKIIGVYGEGQQRLVRFEDGSPTAVFIQFTASGRGGLQNKIDYYLSLPHIVSNMNFYYVDKVHFGGHEWAKVAYLDEKDFLFCGYVTRKDDRMILILSRTEMWDKEKIDLFKKYKEAAEMPDAALVILDGKFKKLDEAIEIQY